MLRASKRLLRPGGRLGFFTIHITPGLTPARRRRASASGPPAVASRRGQLELLRSAGFHDLEEVDLTEEYRETQEAWYREWRDHEAELVAAVGRDLYEERQRDRRLARAGIRDGLLRRSLFLARC